MTSLSMLGATVSLAVASSAVALGAAAPDSAAKVSTQVSTLTFNVTARVGTVGPNEGTQQTVEARVLLRGQTARVETNRGGTPAVVLFSPPYIYRLLPNSKAGVRWKVSPNRASNFSDFDPQTLLRNPALLKSSLVRGGAKRTGLGLLGSTPVEIYEAPNFGRKGQRVKLWLRRTDSLPLRLEARGSELQITASWRDYTRPTNLSATLFAPPKGFRVREVAGPPPFSML